MKNVSKKVISAANINPSQNSAAIDASQMYSVSLQADILTGSSPIGSVKLQCSNDVSTDGTLPSSFVPTNWSDIPNATVNFTSTGPVLIPTTLTSYRWIRVVVTYTSGTGTITCNIFGICV